MNTRLKEVGIPYPELLVVVLACIRESSYHHFQFVPVITLGGDSSSLRHVFVTMVSVFPRALSSNSVAVAINLGAR